MKLLRFALYCTYKAGYIFLGCQSYIYCRGKIFGVAYLLSAFIINYNLISITKVSSTNLEDRAMLNF